MRLKLNGQKVLVEAFSHNPGDYNYAIAAYWEESGVDLTDDELDELSTECEYEIAEHLESQRIDAIDSRYQDDKEEY